MQRKLMARNKKRISAALRYARQSFVSLPYAANLGRFGSEACMRLRHYRRFGAVPDWTQAQPWIWNVFLVPLISPRGVVCSSILVGAKELEEMLNA